MNHHTDVIVVGAGAAGLAAAVRAGERYRNVLLLEKSDRIDRKILASGNGRCNLMNSGRPRYYGDPDFAGRVLRSCPPEELKRFFRHYGLALTEEEDGRIYPLTYQSASVATAMKAALELSGVRLMTRQSVLSAEYGGGRFSVRTETGEVFSCGSLVITCGGAAHPDLGGTGEGYSLLETFGHHVVPPKPALVPLETDRKSISGLSGIRVRCKAVLFDGNSLLHDEDGEVLFTDYGVSGICIMQCARFVTGPDPHIELHLLDRFYRTDEKAGEELRRRKELFRGFSPAYLLEGILPSRLSYAVMKQAGIPMRGETLGDLSEEDICRIEYTANHYTLRITGTRGLENAQVTSGGALCGEFDPGTMSSLTVPGLFAAGEVLNVDGDCGGFNLMFAFASGMIAGAHA